MSFLLAAAFEVGAAVTKSIFKLWVKDSALGEDISSSLTDLVKSKTSDAFAQRKGERQFGDIGDKISSDILPLLEYEGAALDDGERSAVAFAAAETLNKARLSRELLLDNNLQPIRLMQHIQATSGNATRDFSAAGTVLYNRIIQEACTYIIDIASRLPAFTEHTFAEILKREDQILARVDQVLAELRRMRENHFSADKADQFEKAYREAVARNLDVLYLIGADVSLPSRRHKLSVAYIALSVLQQLAPDYSHNTHTALSSTDELEDEPARSIVSVETALANSRRLLIHGPAGSGKTTLLQWIAVQAATRSFEGELAHWNGRIPFYIRLRHYAQSQLPRPEAFPDFAAPLIVGTMPEQWVHDALHAGRAIVLVDGVDEIAASQRQEVHAWLRDLVETYQDCYFVVTSRPHAIESGWMNHEEFEEAQLQDMSLADIHSFIDHWHEAVRQEVQTEEEQNELIALSDHLKEHIRAIRAIRNLATSPLLCAMLCALNRDRRRQLPVNRIELYQACCSLLLERREKESRIDLSDYPNLNYSQKQRLLADLAYWMTTENLTETQVAVVDARFTSQLANMPLLSQDANLKNVRQLLVERSGIIREPISGQIDFAHRTFQEFFAAQAAVESIEYLIAHAHLDQWREVIILSAGLALKNPCEQLISGLIQRGDEEKNYRHQLHLIAVSCLETAIELGPTVRDEIEKRLGQLVPPKNMTDAKALAKAGESAVQHLNIKKLITRYKKLPGATCAACVRTLALIGGEAALEMLKAYAADRREQVVNELLKAWDMFDRETYFKHILVQALQKRSSIRLEHLSSLNGIQLLSHVTELAIVNCDRLTDLSPLTTLANLSSLELSYCNHLTDLSPLTTLANLSSLELSYCNHLTDLSPLATLSYLRIIYGYNRLTDLSPLATLTTLSYLNLSYCYRLTDLSPLATLTTLSYLNLSHCYQLTDLTPLANLTNLSFLNLADCDQLTDLTPLANLANLSDLNLYGCIRITDLTPLANLPNLHITK